MLVQSACLQTNGISQRLLRHLYTTTISLKASTKQSTTNKKEPIQNVTFFARLFDMSYSTAQRYLERNRLISEVHPDNVLASVKMLNQLNISMDEIQGHPSILLQSANTIDNRHTILNESGFSQIVVYSLIKYVSLMNRSAAMLKVYGYIPNETVVIQKLATHLPDVTILPNLKIPTDSATLNDMRQIVLNVFLQKYLNITDAQMASIWKTYPRLRHKSYRSVLGVLHLLENDLKMTREKIVSNAFLLYADPENIVELLKMPTVGGTNFREVLLQRPKILMSSHKAITAIEKHVTDFGIPVSSIGRCLDILTLSPTTVLERLKDLRKINEFSVLATHPRVLRLVHYQNKARLRLDYLKQLRVKCASLHILSSTSETFEKYARDGSDRTKGRDLIFMLAKQLRRTPEDTRLALSRHPSWCHVPIIAVKQTLDFMKLRQYSCDEIFHNIHLLLYPKDKVEEKLTFMSTPKNIAQYGLKMTQITRTQLLGIVLYLIETDHHFTGDGVWAESNQSEPYIIPPALQIGNEKLDLHLERNSLNLP